MIKDKIKLKLSTLMPLFVLLSAFLLSSLLITYHYTSINKSIIETSKGHLFELLQINDYPEAHRQLEGILKRSDFVSYRLLDDTNKIVLKNVNYAKEHDYLNLEESFQFNIKNLTFFIRNRSALEDKSFTNSFLVETFVELPLYPFIFSFVFFSLVYWMYQYFMKKTAVDVKKETTKNIVHNLESKAKALQEHLEKLDSRGKLIDENSMALKLSKNFIDTLYIERRTDILESNKASSITDIEELLDYLMAYKRIDLMNRDIDLIIDNNQNSNFPYLAINPVKLDSILSNMIDNSAYACRSNKGIITISYSCDKNNAYIRVIDNGKGIDASDFEKIFERSYSKKEKKGTGIGLSYAKNVLNSFDSTIKVEESKEGKTVFLLTIPIANSSELELDLCKYKRIVVADDENFAHKDWSKKFERFNLEKIHFSSISELQSWINDQESLNETLFLIDYEFEGEKFKGSDVILKNNIGDRSFLVTNKAHDQALKTKCKKNNIFLIHKKNISKVSISKESYFQHYKMTNEDTVIILDDDKMLTKQWEIQSRRYKQNIVVYNQAQELLDDIDKYEQGNTIIFIDQELNENLKGHDVSRYAKKKGFENLFSITAHSSSNIVDKSKYLAITGKAFPESFWQ